MKFYPSLFLKEALLFGLTLGLSILVSARYLKFLTGSELVQPSSITVGDVIGFLLAIFVLWLAARRPRLAFWIFWIFLANLILAGGQIISAVFVVYPWNLIIPLLILIIFLLWRNVLIHDLAIMAAIAGIGALIGLMITPALGLLAFVILSFYDIIAVYKTRHMVQMAEGMIHSGAIFGFIIPARFIQFFAPRREAQARIGSEFTILGSGDIGLPVIFVSSLVRESLTEALVVSGFVLIGLLLTHILFVSQKQRRPMAALPPIATLTIIGYVVSLLIR